MSKTIPSVRKFMSVCPHTIGADQTLARAQNLQRELKIRHLPVLNDGKLVGMISERDLALVESLRDVDPQTVVVADAMSSEVYTVAPDAPLDEVVGEMAAKKYGSAVVLDNHKVVGIFTTTDACSALAELLHGRLTH